MKALNRARAKISHHAGRQWKGYLIPSDVLALHNGGAKFDKDDIQRVKDQKANGINTPRWFYFVPPDDWKE